MTDTALPKSMRTGKIPLTRSDGSRYYKRGGYVCDFCPYSEDKVCAKCVFAVWNVLGVKAGFSPKEAYRQAHKDDISASPMMQQFKTLKPIDWHVAVDNVLPNPNHIVKGVKLPFFPVKSWNSMMHTLDKLNMARRKGGIV